MHEMDPGKLTKCYTQLNPGNNNVTRIWLRASVRTYVSTSPHTAFHTLYARMCESFEYSMVCGMQPDCELKCRANQGIENRVHQYI